MPLPKGMLAAFKRQYGKKGEKIAYAVEAKHSKKTKKDK